MRVLVAPGSFGGALSAVEAATAIALGWARRAPADQLVLAPVSDGGAGFVDALHASLGGDLVSVTVPDVCGGPAPGSVLRSGHTAYVEAAQVVCAGLPSAAETDGERASSLGVGRLVATAIAAGVTRVVVGVGGAGPAANDGGAGVLAGLGAVGTPPGALTAGAAGLAQLSALDLSAVAKACAGVVLVLATDDDTPLLGLLGTTSTAGPQRGISAERIPAVDGYLEHFASLAGHRHALSRGAGAGGGVGYGLLVAGATKAPGLDTVAEEIGLAERMAQVDLVVTGEGSLDFSAGSGRLSAGIATLAGSAVRPCVALAGHVTVGARETRARGIESAYGVADVVPGGGTGDPAADLAALAERVARTWSWSR